MERLAEDLLECQPTLPGRVKSAALADLRQEIGVAEHVERRLQPLVLAEVDQDRGGLALARDDYLLLALGDATHELRKMGLDLRDGQRLRHRFPIDQKNGLTATGSSVFDRRTQSPQTNLPG